jgi:hypothetical protein
MLWMRASFKKSDIFCIPTANSTVMINTSSHNQRHLQLTWLLSCWSSLFEEEDPGWSESQAKADSMHKGRAHTVLYLMMKVLATQVHACQLWQVLHVYTHLVCVMAIVWQM